MVKEVLVTPKKIWELEVKYERGERLFIWVDKEGIQLVSHTMKISTKICYKYHDIVLKDYEGIFAVINEGTMSFFDCKIAQYSDMSFTITPL